MSRGEQPVGRLADLRRRSEGLEMTLELLSDSAAVARVAEGLAALSSGEDGVDLATVRADLARRRTRGA